VHLRGVFAVRQKMEMALDRKAQLGIIRRSLLNFEEREQL
jgi:hypothetical protein